MTEEKSPAHLIVGRLGEDAACKYLKKHKYMICERNYRYGRSEIDIIAKKDGFIVFFEIKTRSFSSEYSEPYMYSRPADAVNYEKRKNLIKAAMDYLRKDSGDEKARFDVLEIYFVKHLDTKYKLHRINHIESAFDSRGHIIY